MKFFDIRLLLKHPEIDPDYISEVLFLPADLIQKKGEKIVTPKGRVLKGVYPLNVWSYTWKFRSNEIPQDELFGIVKVLYNHKSFFREFKNNQSSSDLFLSLPGHIGRGVMFHSEAIKMLLEIDLNLGFEIFPDWEEDRKPYLTLV